MINWQQSAQISSHDHRIGPKWVSPISVKIGDVNSSALFSVYCLVVGNDNVHAVTQYENTVGLFLFR